MNTRLIALVGHAGAGKDTVASFMPGRRFSFAETLKRFTQEVFAFADAQVWGVQADKERPDPRYTRADGLPLTPRHAMQQVGNLFRQLHPTIWAEAGVRKAVEWLGSADSSYTIAPRPLAVITDCRFINEAQEVRRAGGEVWRIVRPGHTLPPEVANHPSETEQDTMEMEALVNRHIYNGGTLEQLRAETLSALASFLDA